MGIEYLGEKLRAIRKSKGWTQTQLAKRLHLVTGTISSYETGQKYPSIEVLIKICQLFDTSSDYLLGLNDDQIPLKMGALSEAQMQPFLQIIAEVAQYNTLRKKRIGTIRNNSLFHLRKVFNHIHFGNKWCRQSRSVLCLVFRYCRALEEKLEITRSCSD